MTFSDIEYYRKRAAEARMLADLAQDSSTRMIHRQMAEEYEARAEQLAARNFSRSRHSLA